MTQEEINVDEAQVGRILHYVTPSGKCRPGIVVEDWGGNFDGKVNLQVFMDGSNDAHMVGESAWKTSIPPNHQVKEPHTWHWPRECKSTQAS